MRPADDRKRDDDFLRALLDGIDDDLWPAFDLRHPSWDGVEALLEGRDAVRVNQLDAPAPFRYLRLREPPYDDAALSAWADRLRPLLDDGLAVHCYFRHEDEPTAPAYARRLLELVAGGDSLPGSSAVGRLPPWLAAPSCCRPRQTQRGAGHLPRRPGHAVMRRSERTTAGGPWGRARWARPRVGLRRQRAAAAASAARNLCPFGLPMPVTSS